MKKLIASVALLLVGCADANAWVPDLAKGPVVLDMSPEIIPEHWTALRRASAQLNTSFDAPVIFLSSWDGLPGKHEIGVSEKSGMDENVLAGQSIFTHDRCFIELTTREDIVHNQDIMQLVAMHEILHCLGYDHVEDPTDVMHHMAIKGQELKPYLIEDVNARLRGE